MVGTSGSKNGSPHPPVAVIGTGLFGTAVADRLLADGFPVFVHNRTREKADPLLAGCNVVRQSAPRMRSNHLQRLYDGTSYAGPGANAERPETRPNRVGYEHERPTADGVLRTPIG